MNIEQKAMRILAGTAVFWSFFMGTAISAQGVADWNAYINEPLVRAEQLERNAAALIEARRELRDIREQQVLGATTYAGHIAQSAPLTYPPQETSVPVPEPTQCPRPSQSLARGGKNMPDEVKALQQFLAERYQQKTEDVVTGHFGPLTERLLAKFQSEQGLPPVGVLGPLTRAAIARTCGGTTTSTNETTVPQPETNTQNKKAARIVVSAPQNGAVYKESDTMTVSWRVSNAPRNSRVRVTTTLAQTDGAVPGGVSGGSYQQAVPAGTSEGSYTKDWGLNEYLTGTYQVQVHLEACAVEGCDYYYGPTQIYAKALPVTITLEQGSRDVLIDSFTGTETLDTNSDTTLADDEGVFTIKFTVTALESDLWLNKSAVRGYTMGTAGANYRLINKTRGEMATSGVAVASLTSTAATDGTRFKIPAGENEDFTLTVTFDPLTSDFYSAELYSLNFAKTNTNPTTQYRQAFATDALSI